MIYSTTLLGQISESTRGYVSASECEVIDDTFGEFDGFIRLYCHIWKIGDWLGSGIRELVLRGGDFGLEDDIGDFGIAEPHSDPVPALDPFKASEDRTYQVLPSLEVSRMQLLSRVPGCDARLVEELDNVLRIEDIPLLQAATEPAKGSVRSKVCVSRYHIVSGDGIEAAKSDEEGKISDDLKLSKIMKSALSQKKKFLGLRAKGKKVLYRVRLVHRAVIHVDEQLHATEAVRI